MATITKIEFASSGPRAKFPHTGPVADGDTYTAALKGRELTDVMGVRKFFSADGAALAIVLEVEK